MKHEYTCIEIKSDVRSMYFKDLIRVYCSKTSMFRMTVMKFSTGFLFLHNSQTCYMKQVSTTTDLNFHNYSFILTTELVAGQKSKDFLLGQSKTFFGYGSPGL